MIGSKINEFTITSTPYSTIYGGKTRKMFDAVCSCGVNTKLVYSPSNNYPQRCSKCKSLLFRDRLKAKKMRSSWAAMKRRCKDERESHYKYYKGKGIAYCERWEKFPKFYEDMEATWFLGAQLDRYPNTAGNYEPVNCRWATTAQQQRNKECIVLNAEKVEEIRLSDLSQKRLSEIYGVDGSTISRIKNNKRWNKK